MQLQVWTVRAEAVLNRPPINRLHVQIKLEDAEQKKTVAEGIAENVSREKAIVEVETSKAQVQAEQVAKTQAEVSIPIDA